MPPASDSKSLSDTEDLDRSSPAFSRNTSSTSSQASSTLPSIKCVLVGDAAVGKTSLIASYSMPEQAQVPGHYFPTTFDNYAVSVTVEDKPIKFQLCDTSGQHELSSLTSVWYNDADVFLLCFDVTDPHSFENVSTKWLPEIKKFCPDSPIVLAGLKSDKRSSLLHDVPQQAGSDLASHITRCVGFYECSSAESKHQIKEVFDLAIFAALDHHGFVKKRRGLSSFRCKKYKCKSELWSNQQQQSQQKQDSLINNNFHSVCHKSKKSFAFKNFFSCFSGS